MHTTQLHNASASLYQCERQPLSKTALAQEFAFHLDRICSIKRVDTVDIARQPKAATRSYRASRPKGSAEHDASYACAEHGVRAFPLVTNLGIKAFWRTNMGDRLLGLLRLAGLN